MEMSRREYLGIYLAKNPGTPAERNINAEKRNKPKPYERSGNSR
jgi:hypothetical protein